MVVGRQDSVSVLRFSWSGAGTGIVGVSKESKIDVFTSKRDALSISDHIQSCIRAFRDTIIARNPKYAAKFSRFDPFWPDSEVN